MRVLLIQPPLYDPWSTKVFPPLSLAYLAGQLLTIPGVEVRIHDGLLDQIQMGQEGDEPKEHLLDVIREYQPRLIGLSNAFTSMSEYVAEVSFWIRGVTDAPIIMGGTHASCCPEQTLQESAADLVAIGEGEFTLEAVTRAVMDGQPIHHIAGTAAKTPDGIVMNEPRPLAENLDIIPMAAWRILPMKRYFDLNSPVLNMRLPKTVMLTSRGCLGNCIYCAAHKIWGVRHWRGRSAENVLEEIEYLYHEWGVREIDFEDDNMATDPERLRKICELIIERKLDFRWKCPGGIGHWTLTPDLVKLMRRAGCYRLTLGIESASQERRKSIGKTWSLEQAAEIINAAHDLGMWINGTFIMGFPQDNREIIMESVRWLDKSNLDFASFYIPAPYPGTPLTRWYAKRGLDVSRDMLKNDNVPYATDHLTKEEMTAIYDETKQFIMRRLIRRFANPVTFLRKLRSWEDVRYVLRLAWFAAKLIVARTSLQEVKMKKGQSALT